MFFFFFFSSPKTGINTGGYENNFLQFKGIVHSLKIGYYFSFPYMVSVGQNGLRVCGRYYGFRAFPRPECFTVACEGSPTDLCFKANEICFM